MARRRRGIGMGVWGARPPDNVSVGTLFGARCGGQTNLKRANPRSARRKSARSRKTMARRRRATAVPPKGGLWRTGTPPVQEPDKGNGATRRTATPTRRANPLHLTTVDAAAIPPQRYDYGRQAKTDPTDRRFSGRRQPPTRPERQRRMGNRQKGQPTRAARRASAAPQAGRERARRRHIRLGGWCCNGGGRAKRTRGAVADKLCGGGGGLVPPRPPTALPVGRWLAVRECRQDGSPLGAWRRAPASDLRAL